MSELNEMHWKICQDFFNIFPKNSLFYNQWWESVKKREKMWQNQNQEYEIIFAVSV